MRSSLAYCTFCSFNELLFYLYCSLQYSVFRLFLIYFHVFFQYVNERVVISKININAYSIKITLVENIGVEPMTSCVQGRRSSQLS